MNTSSSKPGSAPSDPVLELFPLVRSFPLAHLCATIGTKPDSILDLRAFRDASGSLPRTEPDRTAGGALRGWTRSGSHAPRLRVLARFGSSSCSGPNSSRTSPIIFGSNKQSGSGTRNDIKTTISGFRRKQTAGTAVPRGYESDEKRAGGVDGSGLPFWFKRAVRRFGSGQSRNIFNQTEILQILIRFWFTETTGNV